MGPKTRTTGADFEQRINELFELPEEDETEEKEEGDDGDKKTEDG